MTNRQFWKAADSISDSLLSADKKSNSLAELLKTAYEENLKMYIQFVPRAGTAAQVFENIDEAHPNTIGNRGLLCYTSRKKAEYDIRSKFCGMIDCGQASVRDILNNLFNKSAVGRLLFNNYSDALRVVVEKKTLKELIPGPYPLPPNFVDAPVKGYPVISQNPSELI